MRKTLNVTITDEGRDKGKCFVVTEMPVTPAEKWAVRAFQGLAKSGVHVPEDVQKSGIVGIATIGFKALGAIPWVDLEPLLDEMFQYVQIMPDPARPSIVRNLVEDDIEEIKTKLKLRLEVFQLITGFSLADAN